MWKDRSVHASHPIPICSVFMKKLPNSKDGKPKSPRRQANDTKKSIESKLQKSTKVIPMGKKPYHPTTYVRCDMMMILTLVSSTNATNG